MFREHPEASCTDEWWVKWKQMRKKSLKSNRTNMNKQSCILNLTNYMCLFGCEGWKHVNWVKSCVFVWWLTPSCPWPTFHPFPLEVRILRMLRLLRLIRLMWPGKMIAKVVRYKTVWMTRNQHIKNIIRWNLYNYCIDTCNVMYLYTCGCTFHVRFAASPHTTAGSIANCSTTPSNTFW